MFTLTIQVMRNYHSPDLQSLTQVYDVCEHELMHNWDITVYYHECVHH